VPIPARKRSIRLATTTIMMSAAVSAVAAPATASAEAGRVGAAAACAPPPGVTCQSGVPYGSGAAQTLDLYYPTGATGEPSIVVIHGGGWRSNDSRTPSKQAIYFAQNGFAAFSINYTLSTPSTPSWPQVFTDVEAATRWVHTHAATYGADGTRLGAYGPSAGGHLSALLDTSGPEDGIRIKTAVALSGPMDLGITYREGGGGAATDVTQLLGCVPGSCPNDEDVDASPISHVSSDDGSLLFFNSDNEVIPVDGAYAMNDALQAASVPHSLVVIQNSTLHATAYLCEFETVLGQRSRVIDGIVRWFGKYLSGTQVTPTGTYCSAQGAVA
jgi:acetyl esterase/lipase